MALLHLFMCLCLYQAIPTLARQTPKKCSPNQQVMINLENQYEITISDLDLNVSFDRLDVLGEPSNQNVTEVLLGPADVIISGHLYPKENYTDSKIERSFNTNSLIVRHTQEGPDEQHKKVSCKVVGANHSSKSLTQQERIEFVLHGLAESCLEIQICEQFNAMISQASLIRDLYKEKSKNRIISRQQRSLAQQTFTGKLRSQLEKSLQSTINSIFDFGVAAALTKLVDSKGLYHLPNIVKSYTLAGGSGDFTMTDGIFEGLTSLKRTKDIVFSNNKNHYAMGTTIRLSKAKVNIPSYKGRYGLVNIHGHVILHVKGISLTVKVSVNYNSSPCKIHLDEMRIHDVGNIDVDISGLGWPLNNILEPVIRGIIRTTAFEKAKQTIAEQASQLNCEKYRPAIELMN